MECESAQDLSHEVCGVMWRADSVHVRHASVEVQVHCVNVVIGVLVMDGELLVVVRVVPVLLVMLQFIAHLFSQPFTGAIFHVDFAELEVLCLQLPTSSTATRSQ